jgi:hypothetical protein
MSIRQPSRVIQFDVQTRKILRTIYDPLHFGVMSAMTLTIHNQDLYVAGTANGSIMLARLPIKPNVKYEGRIAAVGPFGMENCEKLHLCFPESTERPLTIVGRGTNFMRKDGKTGGNVQWPIIVTVTNDNMGPWVEMLEWEEPKVEEEENESEGLNTEKEKENIAKQEKMSSEDEKATEEQKKDNWQKEGNIQGIGKEDLEKMKSEAVNAGEGPQEKEIENENEMPIQKIKQKDEINLGSVLQGEERGLSGERDLVSVDHPPEIQGRERSGNTKAEDEISEENAMIDSNEHSLESAGQGDGQEEDTRNILSIDNLEGAANDTKGDDSQIYTVNLNMKGSEGDGLDQERGKPVETEENKDNEAGCKDADTSSQERGVTEFHTKNPAVANVPIVKMRHAVGIEPYCEVLARILKFLCLLILAYIIHVMFRM